MPTVQEIPSMSSLPIVPTTSRRAYRRGNGSVVSAVNALYELYNSPAGKALSAVAKNELARRFLGPTEKRAPKAQVFQAASVPAARSTVVRPRRPRIASSQGAFTVTHTERLTEVNDTTGNDNIAAYAMNPGLGNTFHWINGFAPSFSKWKFEEIVIRYRTTSATDKDGQVGLGWNPNAYDPVPSVIDDFYNLKHSTVGAVWKNFELKLPAGSKWLFTRTGSLTEGDRNNFDHGVLFLLRSGITSGRVGDLWITYRIAFKDPQQNECPGTYWSTEQNVDATHLFGASDDDIVKVGDFPASVINSNRNRLRLLSTGTFQVAMHISGTGITAFSKTTTGNATSYHSRTGIVGATGTSAYITWIVQITDLDDFSITSEDFSVTATTVTASHLYISNTDSDTIN